jgi:hypothetical protein
MTKSAKTKRGFCSLQQISIKGLLMLFVLIGVITAFNFIVLLVKYKLGRYFDLFLDVVCLAILTNMFSSAGQGGTIIAMISSLIISIYLFFNPPTLFGLLKRQKEYV